MAKFTLDIVDDYPYIVFGINATTSDYRLCWNVNKVLELSLKRIDSQSVYSKANGTSLHSCFSFTDENLQLTYHLIENKRGNSIYLPEVRNADFLLILGGNIDQDYGNILQKLKEIRSVIIAFTVDVDALKHKQNLLYIG